MPFGKFVLAAGLALFATASASAGTVTSTWNNWSAAGNPGVSGGVGALTPAASSQFPASLTIDNTGSMYGGLYGGFYYTGAADAEFVLSGTLQGDVSSLALSMISAGNSFISQPSLTIGGQAYAFDAYTSVDAGQVEGFGANLLTFVWDLAGLGGFADGSQYAIGWSLNAHSAFTEISNSQTGATAAVPEPTSLAMLACGGVLALALRRRIARA
jgi:hypothetical protein